MPSVTTLLSDLINPQVMADMITAKIPNKIVVAPFAKVDTTLQGVPGDTVTVPQYAYIGDAEDIAEGVAVESVALTASTTSVTVKKAMRAVTLTDEAVLSGYGNPVAQANEQLAKSIASKIDKDAMTALLGAQLHFDGSSATVKYTGLVDAIDIFEEEVNTDKVMFIHPKQVTQIRKDSDFISADKYPGNVMMTGEIGMIANTRIVPSKRVSENATWYKFDAAGSLTIVASGAGAGEVNLADVTPTLPTAEVGDKVTLVSTACYFNPIVKLENDAETEEDAPALTLYLKRDTNVEDDRIANARKTEISVDKFYTVALSNTSKVVLARFKK